MSKTPKQKIDLGPLDRGITRAKIVAAIAFLLIPGSYLFWFWFVNDHVLSLTSADWGTFGDFVGGVLNPMIAFFAFYWLTKSIRLQKEELSETRIALAEASLAQKDQASQQLLANRLQALDSKLRVKQSEIEHHLNQIEFYATQGHKKVIGFSGDYVSTVQAIKTLQVEFIPLQEERDEIQEAIDRLLESAEKTDS